MHRVKTEPEPKSSGRSRFHVAIIGRPNVGKSALFNRLIGRKQAIVHDQPGVTRDRLTGVCDQGKQPFHLTDTGGIGGAGETELTASVRKMVNVAVTQSDLLLFLVDGQHGLSPIDADVARWLRKTGKPVVLVINKLDHPRHEDFAAEFDSLGFDDPIAVSAAHGRGIPELLDRIDRELGARSTGDPATEPSPQPLRVAIVGRPNVGKSSLVNAITHSEHAIVSELPGTTRDAVDIAHRRGTDEFLFIDTAGIRKRGRHSSSIEVFSVMRAERSIERAELCILVIDITSGVTAQDKKIAGMIQEAGKPALVIINKFDLMKAKPADRRAAILETVADAKTRLFFLEYAPVLVTSAVTGEDLPRLFRLINTIQRAARTRIGTGPLNRLIASAVAANPPPMISGRRLKVLYATQPNRPEAERLHPPQFVLFVNDPKLLGQTYRRYLEARIRDEQGYPGLPILFKLRARAENQSAGRRPASRVRVRSA